MKKKEENNLKKVKNNLKGYAKYSGIAFQMLIVILLGVFGGFKLDKYLEFRIPVFTIVGSIVSVSLAIYIAIKDVLKK
jgi:F0F1-type ATP synthase assembly protein I